MSEKEIKKKKTKKSKSSKADKDKKKKEPKPKRGLKDKVVEKGATAATKGGKFLKL